MIKVVELYPDVGTPGLPEPTWFRQNVGLDPHGHNQRMTAPVGY